MKLRIKGNSIRLRVSRSDVSALTEGFAIQDTVHFANDSAAGWTYGIVCIEGLVESTIRYEGSRVIVTLSGNDARRWSTSEEVGIYFSHDIGPHGTLEVLVEKDFACLERSEEGNADTFPNPLAGTNCQLPTLVTRP